jgi:hypothetical protein
MYLRQHEGKNRKRGVTAKEQEEKKQKARVAQLEQKPDKRGRDKKGKAESKKAKSLPVAVVPIIIVPAAQTSKISLLNTADLLEKGQWVPVQRKKEELIKGGPKAAPSAAAAKKKYKFEAFVHTSQREDGTEASTEFEVVEDTSHFDQSDWHRVIAIFTNGKDWEFKGWKLGDPAAMFHRVPGFYVAFKVC